MNTDILNIFNNYAAKQKYADAGFIDKISKIIIDYYQLNKYVKNIYTVTNKCKINNQYSYVDNYIFFNLNKLHDSVAKYQFNDNYYLFYNLSVLTIIFHEFTHVHQEQIKNEDSNSLLSTILLLADPLTYLKTVDNDMSLTDKIYFRYNWKKYRSYYCRHYMQSPEERMAIISSFVNILEIINLLPYEESAIDGYKRYVDYELDSILKWKYAINCQKTNSPTIDYLKKMPNKINKDILKDGFKLPDNLTYDERLFIGLSLTDTEFINLCSNDKAKIKKLDIMY